MKTKEIDVWINRENIKADNPCLIDLYTDLNKYKREYYGEPIKVKLIIEVPEKKIEITEEQLDDIWNDGVYANARRYEKKKKELGF